MLKTAGYNTGAFGKWHLGGNFATIGGGLPFSNGSNVDHSQPFTGGPLDNGFDTFYGILCHCPRPKHDRHPRRAAARG
jgi:arylsulfatase A-like enzyme